MIKYEKPFDGYINDEWVQIAGFDYPKRQVWVTRDEKLLLIGKDVQIKNLPTKLQKLIQKWKNLAIQLKSINFNVGYELFDSSTSFIYRNHYYKLKPFSIESDATIYDLLIKVIEHDLQELKCPYICSYSFDEDISKILT